jgi:hypothetical protein
MLNSSILFLFFEYLFTLSAHFSSTLFLVGTKENTFVYIAVLFASKHRTRMNSSVTYILDTNCALPLIKAHLNIGTELKCEVQEDLVYCANGNIFINWEVVNISLPTLTYCKYDVIWRPPYEAKKHNFYTFKNESAQWI